MAGTMPHVEQGLLTLGLPGAEVALRVGEPDWFSWLEMATAFTFVCSAGTFTARRERASSGRGGWYWRAYQRRAGKLRRAYLGKAAELTLERLQAVAAQLANAGAAEQALDMPRVGADAPPAVPREQQALPSGTVTFLFTDIVGSSQLWEQHHAAMGTALARHDALLRQAIGAHSGVVFKTVGDSAHAVFARAPDALAAALAAQRALYAEAWDLPTPLRVRMALHTGAAELRDGDYFGGPLNRLARILVLGHGGQILLSRATHDLVADELPAQTSLRALGDYQLKDLARPEPIFQCVSADLPADFPPLCSDNLDPGAGTPTPQLLATKLYLPRARPDLVARPRLFARLDAGLHGALTLVCAPAGFGKTTLLAEWLRRMGRPAAWLGLDAGDSDPALFLRYLVAALQTLAPEVGATLSGLLQSPQPPPLESLLTLLVNDLATVPQECILVLDDYHMLAGPPILQAVSFLLDHLPPELHLIIATREDPPLPLARLRARRQVAELRADQLRFTTDEAAVFLTEVMGLRLSPADVAALETRTEGWIAGLQFAALAMQDHADHAGFIAAFTGSNRFVVDYLADEVLRSQPSHIQTFLLQTSILDRMCGPLCDAVLGVGSWELGVGGAAPTPNPQLPTPGAAYSQLLLEQLERANLFVTPLDDERRWYRYHHLFGEVLRERLRRGAATTELATLHHRASTWYEQQGLLAEAIQHALAGQDFVLAARLIESVARRMILRGETTTLMGWLAALPDDVVRMRPNLNLRYAWGLLSTGQLPAAEQRLQEVEHGIADHANGQTLLREVAVIRATTAMVGGYFPQAVALARQALVDLPEDERFVDLPEDERFISGAANACLGYASYRMGDVTTASAALAQSSALYYASGHLPRSLAPLRQLVKVQFLQGRLKDLDQTAQHALQLASEVWGSPLVGYTYLSLGELCYERNDLAAAARYFADGVALIESYGMKDILNVVNLVEGYLALAWVQQAQGELASALQLVERADRVIRPLTDTLQARAAVIEPQEIDRPALPRPPLSTFTQLYVALITAGRVRLWLAQGDLAAAVQWARTSGLHADDDELPYLHEREYLTLARVLIARGDLAAALGLLDRLLAIAEAGARMGSALEMLLIRALALQAQGNHTTALTTLERALRLAEPEGYSRIFADEGAPMARLLQAAHTRGIVPDYVETLLPAFPSDELRVTSNELRQPSPPVTRNSSLVTLVEPLTARELEVLRLLADGASNGQIAQRLIVSLGTVKKHIANIFGKLEAQNRTQAVARARTLDLL